LHGPETISWKQSYRTDLLETRHSSLVRHGKSSMNKLTCRL
jgi:hypothetical protein